MLQDRNKIELSKASIDFLDNEYISKHRYVWDSMSEKYEFLDKSITFGDAVCLTKKVLSDELKNKEKVKSIKIRLR